MISLSLPRSRKTCGWSNGGFAPTHMNSCEPISMTATPASLWKCGTTLSAIWFTLVATDMGRNQRNGHDRLATRSLTYGFVLIPIARATYLLTQIRHNLVAPEKPFFRRGRCVANSAHYL